MNLSKERIFSPIEGTWDLRTKYPIVPSYESNGKTVGRFDADKMSIVKKILAMTS